VVCRATKHCILHLRTAPMHPRDSAGGAARLCYGTDAQTGSPNAAAIVQCRRASGLRQGTQATAPPPPLRCSRGPQRREEARRPRPIGRGREVGGSTGKSMGLASFLTSPQPSLASCQPLSSCAQVPACQPRRRMREASSGACLSRCRTTRADAPSRRRPRRECCAAALQTSTGTATSAQRRETPSGEQLLLPATAAEALTQE